MCGAVIVEFVVGRQSTDGIGKRRGRSVGGYEAGSALLHLLDEATHRGRDDRQAVGISQGGYAGLTGLGVRQHHSIVLVKKPPDLGLLEPPVRDLRSET